MKGKFLIAAVLGLGIVGAPGMKAFASCLPAGCKLVQLEVKSCKSVVLSNKKEIDSFLENSGSDSGSASDWLKRSSELSGVELTGKVLRVELVGCMAGFEPQEMGEPQFHAGSETSFFLASNAQDPCDDYSGNTSWFFEGFRCCDTLPATGDCMSKLPVLSAVPPTFRSQIPQ